MLLATRGSRNCCRKYFDLYFSDGKKGETAAVPIPPYGVPMNFSNEHIVGTPDFQVSKLKISF